MGFFKMRILITGGSGYIASRLAQYLSQNSYSVRLATRNLSTISQTLAVEYVEINWHDTPSILRACEGIDAIIHASGLNAADSYASPLRALAVNGLGTATLVQCAIDKRVARLIYISTAHVYSSLLSGNITESTCPSNLHPYATSHLAGESVLLHACSTEQIDGIVLRLSNTFGLPLSLCSDGWSLVVNDLCRQAVTKKSIRIHSDGGSTRDFLPMKSLLHFINNLLCRKTSFASLTPQSILNVGSSKSYSLLDMAKMVQKHCLRTSQFRPPITCDSLSEYPSFCYSSKYHRFDVPMAHFYEELDLLLRFLG